MVQTMGQVLNPDDKAFNSMLEGIPDLDSLDVQSLEEKATHTVKA